MAYNVNVDDCRIRGFDNHQNASVNGIMVLQETAVGQLTFLGKTHEVTLYANKARILLTSTKTNEFQHCTASGGDGVL